MTLTIKQHKNNNYYISMEFVTHNNCFNVSVYPLIDTNMCGYPVREMWYSYGEKAKAQRTFNRYKKTYI